MFLTLAIAVCLIGQIYGATVLPQTAHPSHRPHVKEPNEFDQALFYYDALSHNMVMKLGNTCYLMRLSGHQRQHVHTNDGLLETEIAFMNLFAHGTKTLMDHTDVKQLSIHVEHMCGGIDVYTIGHKHHTTTVSLIG